MSHRADMLFIDNKLRVSRESPLRNHDQDAHRGVGIPRRTCGLGELTVLPRRPATLTVRARITRPRRKGCWKKHS